MPVHKQPRRCHYHDGHSFGDFTLRPHWVEYLSAIAKGDEDGRSLPGITRKSLRSNDLLAPRTDGPGYVVTARGRWVIESHDMGPGHTDEPVCMRAATWARRFKIDRLVATPDRHGGKLIHIDELVVAAPSIAGHVSLGLVFAGIEQRSGTVTAALSWDGSPPYANARGGRVGVADPACWSEIMEPLAHRGQKERLALAAVEALSGYARKHGPLKSGGVTRRSGPPDQDAPLNDVVACDDLVANCPGLFAGAGSAAQPIGAR